MTLAVDTSVLVAIALNEPERSEFIDRIQSATEPVVSAVSVLEAGIVLSVRLRGFATADLMSLVDDLGLTSGPLTSRRPTSPSRPTGVLARGSTPGPG